MRKAKRSDLLSLPERDWRDESPVYDSLLILSDGAKHESGFGMITIIGVVDGEPVEKCTTCSDDLSWHINEKLRTDCILPSRALHFWCRKKGKFRVGHAISSIDIYLDA